MKHYLIDSENVGDFWIPLLEIPADQAELIVFYTKNSPHMSYDSLIKLKESDRKVIFIKCYEGTNALDFQLCSELGYCIARNENDDFIIVTNDTGYDAAVKYWRHKEYSVKRIAGKDMRTGSRKRGNLARYDVAAEVSSILHKLVSASGSTEARPSAEGMEPENIDEQAELSGAVSDTDYDIESTDEPVNGSGGARYEEEADPEYADDPDSEELSADDEEGFETDEDLSEDGEDYDEEPEDAADFGEEPEDEADYDESEDGADEDEPEDEADDDPDEDEPEDDPNGDLSEESAGPDDDAAGADDSDARESGVQEPEEIKSAAADNAPADHDMSGRAEGADQERETDPDVLNIEQEEVFTPDTEELTAIVNCLGMDNLAELHNQLIQFYGDNGKDVYQSIKTGALTFEKLDWSKEEKFLYYCALILRHSDEPEEALAEENIREFAEFLLGAENKRKNLNSLRYALLKHYGKEKGRRYYFMLKPYVKALNQM